MRSLAPRAVRFWPILAATFLADHSTKVWVVNHLGPPGTPHPLLGEVVRFTLTYNDGGALGIDTGPTGLNFLIALSCAVVLGLGVYFRSLPKDTTFRPSALGLLIGGALGNLHDRVGPRPGVVDFIDIGAGSVRFWTFNLADSAIFLGAVLLAWWFWRQPHPAPVPHLAGRVRREQDRLRERSHFFQRCTMRIPVLFSAILLLAFSTPISPQVAPSSAVTPFVVVDAPVFALTHVRVIDGRGGPTLEDQTLVVAEGRIQAMGNAATTPIPPGAEVLERPGYSVLPGMVGMHDHIFYPAGPGHYNTLEYSAPRLYLAAGVTTIRTTGGMEPYTELNLKRAIQEGRIPGPAVFVTSPYLEGPGAFTLQMHELESPEEARKMVAYWADTGIDDFKAYTNITRAQLSAAIDEVHRRGKKITGHLCSVGFREAATLGIDNLEHGLVVNTEFVPGKEPDVCPPPAPPEERSSPLEVEGEEIQETIRQLVAAGVAITSTLPVFEISVPGRPPVNPMILEAMAPDAREAYLTRRARVGSGDGSQAEALLAMEMAFERAFVQAGGLLLAGPDPTGYGGVLPGFGNFREVELLVEAGFSPVEAIQIASFNGADYLGEAHRIGSVEVGKQADLILVRGDPSTTISHIRQVEVVFKEGLGYDSAKLFEAVKGTVGVR